MHPFELTCELLLVFCDVIIINIINILAPPWNSFPHGAFTSLYVARHVSGLCKQIDLGTGLRCS